jgi:anti-sigma B factor antagonist
VQFAQLEITRGMVGTDIVVVVLKGRLTFGQDSRNLEEMLSAAATEGAKRVVLDLNGLTYMDSSGLGTIVKSMTVIKQAGGNLRLAGAKPFILSVFKMAYVDSVLALYPDLQSACAD